MNGLNLTSRKSIARELVIVDGAGRTGTHLTNTLIASLRRFEPRLYSANPIVTISTLEKLGKIERSVAKELIKLEVDLGFWSALLGRNVNLRISDVSSIWNMADPQSILKRIFAESNDKDVIEQLHSGILSPIYLVQGHHILPNASLFFECFENLKICFVKRHPVDVVYSTYKKGWGEKFFNKDPLSFWLTFENNGNHLPWWSLNWKSEFEKYSPLEKLVKGNESVTYAEEQGFSELSSTQKSRVFTCHFERIVTRSEEFLRQVSQFIGTDYSAATIGIMSKERCPRVLLKRDFNEKKEFILKNVRPEIQDLFLSLCQNYEENFRRHLGYNHQDTLSSV